MWVRQAHTRKAEFRTLFHDYGMGFGGRGQMRSISATFLETPLYIGWQLTSYEPSSNLKAALAHYQPHRHALARLG